MASFDIDKLKKWDRFQAQIHDIRVSFGMSEFWSIEELTTNVEK